MGGIKRSVMARNGFKHWTTSPRMSAFSTHAGCSRAWRGASSRTAPRPGSISTPQRACVWPVMRIAPAPYSKMCCARRSLPSTGTARHRHRSPSWLTRKRAKFVSLLLGAAAKQGMKVPSRYLVRRCRRQATRRRRMAGVSGWSRAPQSKFAALRSPAGRRARFSSAQGNVGAGALRSPRRSGVCDRKATLRGFGAYSKLPGFFAPTRIQ